MRINIGGSAGFKIIIALPFSAPPTTSIPFAVVFVNSSILARVPGPADLEATEETISEYLTFFPNSSLTSKAVTGLNCEKILALGAAKGKSSFDNKFCVILFFGNLIAIVFLLSFTNFDILDLFFL